MPRFGSASTNRLLTLDSRLQEILREGIKFYDFSIVCGYRDEKAQNRAFAEGKSQLEWPHSKHNTNPSKAVDVAPWDPDNNRIDWNNRDRFIYLAAFLMGTAHKMGYTLRWGGDWNSDTFMRDQRFHDLPHLEIAD